jgi:hypothetical protein
MRTERAVSVGQPLDRLDAGAIGLHGQHQAGAHGMSVHQHGAGAADAVFTAQMRAGQAQYMAQEIRQRLPRWTGRRCARAVHGHLDSVCTFSPP